VGEQEVLECLSEDTINGIEKLMLKGRRAEVAGAKFEASLDRAEMQKAPSRIPATASRFGLFGHY
jgi:hypothetical protein